MGRASCLYLHMPAFASIGHVGANPVISPRGGRTSAREHSCRGSDDGGHRVLEMLLKTCICPLIPPGVVWGLLVRHSRWRDAEQLSLSCLIVNGTMLDMMPTD